MLPTMLLIALFNLYWASNHEGYWVVKTTQQKTKKLVANICRYECRCEGKTNTNIKELDIKQQR